MPQEQHVRKLTTHQKAVLIQVLRTFPDERVEIRYAPEAADAFSYAQDFLSIFKAIGWDVRDPEAEAPGGHTTGIAIFVPDGKLPPCAEALRDALRIYDIEAKLQNDAERKPAAHSFVFWIGASG
jgi:hypothetical protein